MAERESRKRKATEQGAEYQQELAKSVVQADTRKKSRTIGKEINTDLSDTFGKMKASEGAPEAAAMDVEMDMAARGRRRRKTRKSSKKSKKKTRKTRKH